jgi:hypothetical protein
MDELVRHERSADGDPASRQVGGHAAQASRNEGKHRR